jgi:Initiator Rep protein, WH2
LIGEQRRQPRLHLASLLVERFRVLLGVEPGTLPAFKSLNQRAIRPAAAEVNFLCDFGCAVEPVLAGRKVVKIKLSWWRKNTDELKAAYRELQAAKVGRTARLKGTVEQVTPPLARITDTTPEPPTPPTGLPKVPDGVTVDFDQLLEFYRQHLAAGGEADTSQSPKFLILPLRGGTETIDKLRRLLEEDQAHRVTGTPVTPE